MLIFVDLRVGLLVGFIPAIPAQNPEFPNAIYVHAETCSCYTITLMQIYGDEKFGVLNCNRIPEERFWVHNSLDEKD